MAFEGIDILFGALDTKTDPALLPKGALTLAENATSQTGGIYVKRFGYTALTLVLASCMRLSSLGNELDACDGRVLWSYDSANTTWKAKDAVHEAASTQTPIILDQTKDYKISTAARCNGLDVDAFIDGTSGFVTVRVVGAADGAEVSRSIVDSSGVWRVVHAVTVGTNVIVVFMSTALQQINFAGVDCTTGAIGPSTNIVSGANVSATIAALDVVPVSSTDVVLVWATNVPVVRAWRVNAATAASVAGPQTVSADAIATGVAVACTVGEAGYVLYATGANVRAALFDPATMVQTVAPFTVEALAAATINNFGLLRTDATHVEAWWDYTRVGVVKGFIKWAALASGGTVGTIRGPLRNVVMAAKPFAWNGSYYAPVWFGQPLAANNTHQETMYTVRFDITGATPYAVPVALHAYRSAFTSPPPPAQMGEVVALGGGKFRFNGTIAYKFLTTAVPRGGLSSFGLDFASPTRLLPLEANSECFYANSVVGKYDGVRVVENNFLQYPEISDAAAGAIGASGMDDGVYSYIAIYEASDAKGNTDRSTTSIPVSATTAAGAGLGKVTLTITQLTLTKIGWNTSAQQGNVSVFRTKAGGTTYFYLGSVAIDPTAANATYVDSANDSTIGSHRILYTAGGVLDREPAPSAKHLTLHQGRVWGISSADPKVGFYSGDIVPGEGVWFSSLQQFRAEPGGDLVAVSSMDDKLILFKSDRIFKLYGRGLSATGQSNDLSLPQLISSDCGCIEPRSVVATPDGVMFLTNKGIYLLNRTEQVEFRGASVQYWTDNYTSCTSAVMLPDRREIRFSFSNPVAPLVTPACVDLVYNYDAHSWTTHLKYADTVATDAVSIPGMGYVWAAASGAAYLENKTFLDPGSTYVPMTIELGWNAPAGLQGFLRCQEVLFLGTWKSDHGFEIQVAKDYSDAYTMDRIWSRAELAALPKQQLRFHLSDQKGEAFRVRISDYADGGTTGEGYQARGIRLGVMAKRGSFEKFMSAGAKG